MPDLGMREINLPNGGLSFLRNGAGGLWNGIGGFQGAMTGVGALASLWDTINTSRYNKRLLEEQRKTRERTERELDRRNALQDQYQANVNAVW